MASDSYPNVEPTTEFEHDLTDLIATAFARGVVVEGTRELTVPGSGTPNWTVEISKTYPDDEPTDDPDSIE